MLSSAGNAKVVDSQKIIDGARINRSHFAIGLLCAAILFVDGYNLAVLGYLAPEIQASLGVTNAQLGPIFSASLAGNFFGFLFLSPLSYRFGLKRMTIGFVLLFGLGEICAGLSTSVTQLIVFRFIAGIGLAGGISNATALAGEYFPQRWRATGVTYTYIGFTAGQMASGEATRTLVGQGMEWRAPLLLGGALALGFALILLFKLPESLEYLVNRAKQQNKARDLLNRLVPGSAPAEAKILAEPRSGKSGSVGQLFGKSRATLTIGLWAAMTMNSVAIGAVSSWLTTLLVNAGLSQNDAVATATVATAAGIVAGLIVGPLMDRVGPFRVVLGLFLIGSCATFTLGMVIPALVVPWILALAFCQIMCTSGITKGSGALAVHIYPTALRSTAIGWMLGVSRIGSIAGPLLIGFLLTAGFEPGQAFQIVAIPLLAGGAAMLFCLRAMARSHPAQN